METKKLTIAFGTALAGIAICLVMTIVTGVQEHQVRSIPTPITIPTPAMAH